MVLDKNTRDSHAALHNVILPKDHPFWNKNYPPNGWNCRCKAIAVTKDFLDRHGLEPTKDLPEFKAHPDWDYNVGKTDKLESYYNERVKDLSHPEQTAQNLSEQMQRLFTNLNAALIAEQENFAHARELYVWQAGLNELYTHVIEQGNKTYPLEIVSVGKLKPHVIEAARAILGADIKEAGLVLTKKQLAHSTRPTKHRDKRAFRKDEILGLVRVLDEAKDVYIDTRSEHKNIIFTFDDKTDPEKLNLIPIKVGKTLKKFGVKNYIITLDKVDKKAFVSDIQNKKL